MGRQEDETITSTGTGTTTATSTPPRDGVSNGGQANNTQSNDNRRNYQTANGSSNKDAAYNSTTSTASGVNGLISSMPSDINLPPPPPSASTTTAHTSSNSIMDQMRELGVDLPPPLPPQSASGPPTTRRVPAAPGAYRGSGPGVDQQPRAIDPLYKGGRDILGSQNQGTINNNLHTSMASLDSDGTLQYDNEPAHRPESLESQRRERQQHRDQEREQELQDNSASMSIKVEEELGEEEERRQQRPIVINPRESQVFMDNTALDNSGNDKEKRQQKFMVWGIVLAILVVIIVVIIVGVILGSSKEEPTVSIDVDMGIDLSDPDTSSSSALLRRVFGAAWEQSLPEKTQEAILSQDPKVPQYQAFQWLSQDENILLYSPAQRLQRFVLASLYYATNGAGWFTRLEATNQVPTSELWLNYQTHECDWYSLASYRQQQVCYNYTQGVDLYEHHDYQSLVLSRDPQLISYTVRSELEGTLVPELALLTHLHLLDVGSQGRLKGSIPTELVQLSASLDYVYLENCAFSGAVPDGLLEFPTVLFLSRNRRLDNWQLPTEVGQNSRLSYLLLTEANIVGTLPTELGAIDSRLQQLLVNSNDITGTIPSELGRLSRLNYLDVTSNHLTGGIPSELGLATSLSVLKMSENFEMTGTLPKTLAHLSDLEILDIFMNSIEGALWPELFYVESSISNNENTTTFEWPQLFFVGDFSTENTSTPELVPSWPKLHTLLVTNNELTGPIPSEIGLLSSMRKLFMSRNSFESQLPTELGLLSNLECLGVSGNNLSGELPSELGLLSNIIAVNVLDDLTSPTDTRATFSRLCGP